MTDSHNLIHQGGEKGFCAGPSAVQHLILPNIAPATIPTEAFARGSSALSRMLQPFREESHGVVIRFFLDGLFMPIRDIASDGEPMNPRRATSACFSELSSTIIVRHTRLCTFLSVACHRGSPS